MRRTYSPKVYRQGHSVMWAIDTLEERAKRRGRPVSCECDAGFCCPGHERLQAVAIRYAVWKERGRNAKL